MGHEGTLSNGRRLALGGSVIIFSQKKKGSIVEESRD